MQKIKIILAFSLLILFSCDNGENQTELDQVEMCAFNFVNLNSDPTTKPNAAIINWPRWETGQTIKIKFLDGNAFTQQKVKNIASEWTNYANLKFEYVSKDEYADIRIGFNIGNFGAWSFLGMKSAYGDTNEQSMRLGPLTSVDENSIRRTILHEFGHALGLIHENSSPAAKINWDLPKTYQYYKDLNGWSKEEVDEYVIKSPESTNYTQYDPLSIMHYYIPASLTTDGKAVNEMSALSEIDKRSINEWYPFPVRSVIEVGERIDIITWRKCIKSPNGRYSLEFDSGNLFILDSTNNQKTWSVGKPNYKNAMCFFQQSGEIIISGSRSDGSTLLEIVWRNNISKVYGAQLYLQDNGDLELIQNGILKWSSGNGKT